MQSFYVDIKASVGMDVSELFLVDVGLRQGCVMSLWLFKCRCGWCGMRDEC